MLDNSLDHIGFQNHDNTDFMAASNEDTDSLGDVAETADDDDVDLDSDNVSNSSHEEQHSDDESNFEHNNVVGQKRKRTHSGVGPKKVQLDDTVAFIQDEESYLSNEHSSRVLDTHGRHKRSKTEGSIFCGKRISDELDSDDELMMQMRENGFSDRQIAEKLQKDGRVRYDEKSISTRIGRIRLAQAEKVDFLLKEGYKEWEYEDDKLLIQAYSLADIEINYEIERVRAWRFRKVSDYMRRLNNNALFSSAACRERYNALIDGTARIPTEMDDDPEARRAEMEAYRLAREKTRRKEQAEIALKEATEAMLKAEKKARKAQKAENSANKRAQREAEKAQRATKRAQEAKTRAAYAKENHILKARRNARIKKQNTDQTAKKITPPIAPTNPTAPTTPTAPTAPDVPTVPTVPTVLTASTAPPTTSTAPTASVTTTSAIPVQNPKPKPTKNKKTTSSLPPKPKPKPKPKQKNITAATPDPRSYLSLTDLQKICQNRGIPSTDSDKASLLHALSHEDNKYNLDDLKSKCRAKGLSMTGTKATLKYRLALAAAKACESFREGGAGAGTDAEERRREDEMENEAEE